MSIPMTMAVGIGGSFLAGLISLALFHGRHGGGIILSVLCATGLVWLVRRLARARGSGPGRGRVGLRPALSRRARQPSSRSIRSTSCSVPERADAPRR